MTIRDSDGMQYGPLPLPHQDVKRFFNEAADAIQRHQIDDVAQDLTDLGQARRRLALESRERRIMKVPDSIPWEKTPARRPSGVVPVKTAAKDAHGNIATFTIEEEAAYAVHAANLYPEMLAALEALSAAVNVLGVHPISWARPLAAARDIIQKCEEA